MLKRQIIKLNIKNDKYTKRGDPNYEKTNYRRKLEDEQNG